MLRAFVLMMSLWPSLALAWDGPQLWHEPADGSAPGSGGIFGTGGVRDYRIVCADCHVDPAGSPIQIDFTFVPALGRVGDTSTYQPGQRYEVTARLVGESLGPPCDAYMSHVNGFAATFEDGAGASVGVLESDSGQSQASCPTVYPDPQSGTTVLYQECDVVVPTAGENRTQWRFFWRAPSSGGLVHVYSGGVDGDCGMSSMGDASVAGELLLAQATAQRNRPAPSAPGGLAWTLVPAIMLGGWRLRRKARRVRAR